MELNRKPYSEFIIALISDKHDEGTNEILPYWKGHTDDTELGDNITTTGFIRKDKFIGGVK